MMVMMDDDVDDDDDDDDIDVDVFPPLRWHVPLVRSGNVTQLKTFLQTLHHVFTNSNNTHVVCRFFYKNYISTQIMKPFKVNYILVSTHWNKLEITNFRKKRYIIVIVFYTNWIIT